MSGPAGVHLRRAGRLDRPPIALLHSLALDHTVWHNLLAELPPDLPVLLVDLPGHGMSAPVDQITIEEMADEVAAAIAALQPRPAGVVGLSLGGCVAQALAVRHPELVDSLGLIDTTAWYGPTAASDWEARAATALDRGLSSLASFQVDRWFSPSFPAAHPTEVRRLLDVFASNDLGSYAATCRALGAVDLRDHLHTITAPTVVVVGEDDQATPPDHARAIARSIRGAELVVLPACRHLSPVERPAEVAAALQEVLGLQ